VWRWRCTKSGIIFLFYDLRGWWISSGTVEKARLKPREGLNGAPSKSRAGLTVAVISETIADMPIRSLIRVALVLTLSSLSFLSFSETPPKRVLSADDVYRTQQVANPQVSPDGKWIAYTVTTIDREADKRHTAIWMVNWEGTQDLRLTYGAQSESSPKWSPDGKYLSYTAAASEEGKSQIWLLDRRGGGPRQLTGLKSDLGGYEWSPDGKRILLELAASDDEVKDPTTGKPKPLKPIVTDRYHFKRDIEGYLTSENPQHLYLFDVESKKLEALTGEKPEDKGFEESEAVWSPDGSQIAFVSNHAKEPDQSGTDDIFLVDAHAGAEPRKLLTTYSPGGQHLVWRSDGKQIAFLQGLEPKYNAYGQNRLALAPVRGGTPRVLTEKLDRGVSQVEFSPDGSALTFLVDDDRRGYLGKVTVSGGSVEHINHGDLVIDAHKSAGGHTAAAAAADTSPAEIYAIENGGLRRLTSHNGDLLSELQLGAVEDINFKSKDGTEIHGMMVKPPSYEAGKKYPTLLWIHGGPNGQDEHALDFGIYPLMMERQFFAGRGYVVLAINYRGSSGRGSEFTRSIFADWGNKEVADLLAGVDYVVQKGIADPARLGIGGWSYGGILTDYAIASDPRFKAAISGAGSANQISMYGSDQYILQYNNELAPPWKSEDLWVKLSYPFFRADRIHTPTLFMGGEKDFNVPIAGGEQMYEALRTLGVPTQLVVYPGQFHLFTRPSYIHDRLERYGAWFDKYLKN
jgi:dipeptidyl aminopeptidase/acylaminoacyl peptidase